MTDCHEIGELLDAYALGAVDPQDVGPIEEHLAECLPCWEHLTEIQKSAALLALAVPLEEPCEGLRHRILAQAQAESASAGNGRKFPDIGRRAMPLGFGVLAAGAIAALAWAFVLQNEAEDLRSDYNSLQEQAMVSQRLLSQERELTTLALTGDIQTTMLQASGLPTALMGHYMWSPSSNLGALVCDKMGPAPEGMIYQLWFVYDDEFLDGGTFHVVEGIAHHTVDLSKLPATPLSLSVTMEPLEGSTQPTGDPILIASFSGSPTQ